MYNLNICSETGPLKKVVVGIANDRGNKVYENNPKISKHLQQGTLPSPSVLIQQVDNFAKLIESQNVEVIRPENIKDQDQIFARDIGFVIDDFFILSNMKKSNRKPEQEGIKFLINQISPEKLLIPPADATIEGGDIITHGKYVFVGLTERTNNEGYLFIKNHFPKKEVIALKMIVTDNPATNVLHLDCAFLPVGISNAVIYENGFINKPEIIYDIFGEQNIIKVNQFEMYHMYPNVFSISPDLVISDSSFKRLNEILNSNGIKTFTTDYQEVSKLGGLFRCSTMPLQRD